jgi:hypothetical protein
MESRMVRYEHPRDVCIQLCWIGVLGFFFGFYDSLIEGCIACEDMAA